MSSPPPAGLTTEAVVLRATDFGESDRIAVLLTPDLGRVAAIAKGARRSTRRFPGTLDVFNRIRIQLVLGRQTGALSRLEQATLLTPFAGLRREPARFVLGCYLIELLARLVPEGGSRREAHSLYAFAVSALGCLEIAHPDARLRILLELRALDALGLRPELARCVRCGKPCGDARLDFHPGEGGPVCTGCARASDRLLPVGLGTLRALAQSLRFELVRLPRLSFPPAALAEARALLLELRRFHIGIELRSERVLDAIMTGGEARSA